MVDTIAVDVVDILAVDEVDTTVVDMKNKPLNILNVLRYSGSINLLSVGQLYACL